MNVKDLILSRPPKAVAAAFLEKYQNTPSDQEKAISRILQFIDSLHQIDPIDSGHLILGILQTEEDGDYLDPCLYYKEDLSALSLSASRLCGLESVEGLSEEEMEQLAQGKDLPDSYAFELSPWNEILGYELDTRNIQDVGADELCAAILWEMTFFGFEESHVEEERERLKEILREDEKIRKLPEEEQKNYWEDDNRLDNFNYKDYMPQTDFEIAAERAIKEVNSKLEMGVTYTGTVDDVYLLSSPSYQTLKIICRINLESGLTYAVQHYVFGGSSDEYYLHQLCKMLSDIEGAYPKDFNFTNAGALADSLQKIVGSPVEVKVIENTEDKKKYEITLTGKYDRLTNKVI